MRILLLLTLTLLGSSIGLRANKIDQLQTKQDVEKFLIKKVSKKFKDFSLFEGRPGPDSNALSNSFFKLDINADGLTDLVVNCGSLWVIIDKGEEQQYESYTLFQRDHDMLRQSLVAIDSSERIKKLVISRLFSQGKVLDTLAWQAGGFMEYNATPFEHFEFQGLKASTTGCYGKCPVFELTINPDRTALYKAIRFNKEEGDYTGSVPSAWLASMTELLRHLPLDKIKDNYAAEWTDDQTITVEVRYNGKVKKIVDYGEVGTFGLKRLYGYIFGWKTAIEWEESSSRPGN